MPKPAKFDLDLYRGDSDGWEFVLWEDQAKTDPMDLTGATAAAQIRATTESPEATDLTCAITMPNKVAVSMPASAWIPTTPKTGVWDLQLTWAAISPPRVRTVVAGVVAAEADVTKETP